MTTQQIISKKRDGQELTDEEIAYFVEGYVIGRIPDYQLATLLMAVYLQGMNPRETAALTKAMLHSGEIIDLSDIPGPKVDKHSTGGVGDKVSLILAPLVASAGVNVPMISGRGLLHSGGTLDKLEAIPGFRTNLTVAEFRAQIREIGVAMIGQTEHIVPADKRMYALRDATATVASLPLVTASILSKKLAEGIDALVLDVKTGRGAFFPERKDAEALAHSLIETAHLNGLKSTALITNMDQPLGYACGNWLETKESIDCLKNNGPQDLMDLTYALSAQMLLMAGNVKNASEGIAKLRSLIEDGSAYRKFVEMVAAQGGDVTILENPETFRLPTNRIDVFANQSGYVHNIDALEIGLTVVLLGGGREVVEDSIDYGAGIVLNKKTGDKVEMGDRLATFYTERAPVVNTARENILKSFSIEQSAIEPPELLLSTLRSAE